jgi:predicted nucleic acid-binding protein
MILVDLNIPMHQIGSPSFQKTDALRLLERLVSDRQHLVTGAEVFQEILHQYCSVNRRHDIQRAFDALLNVG